MNRIVLKQEIVDKIKKDPRLTRLVASSLRISPRSLPRLLYGNDSRLTQAGVIMILKKELKVSEDKELFSQIKEVAV